MLKVGLLSLLSLALTSLHAIHSFELKDGSGIRGAIVLERPDVYYVDLGFDVVTVPKAAVVSLGEVDAQSGDVVAVATEETLYRVEGDLGDQRVSGQGCPGCRPMPGQYIHDAGWETGFKA